MVLQICLWTLCHRLNDVGTNGTKLGAHVVVMTLKLLSTSQFVLPAPCTCHMFWSQLFLFEQWLSSNDTIQIFNIACFRASQESLFSPLPPLLSMQLPKTMTTLDGQIFSLVSSPLNGPSSSIIWILLDPIILLLGNKGCYSSADDFWQLVAFP